MKSHLNLSLQSLLAFFMVYLLVLFKFKKNTVHNVTEVLRISLIEQSCLISH